MPYTAGTPVRPQCSRMAVSFYKETQYGLAFNNSGINKMFTFENPPLLDMTQTREDDATLIKGHEFPLDTAVDIVVTQDITLPVAFRANTNVLGWLFSLIAGADTITGTTTSPSSYTHTFKIQDGCVADQAMSTNVIVGLSPDANSTFKLKGVCLNDLKVTIDKAGSASCAGTLQCDGNLGTAQNNYSWSALSSNASATLAGWVADFKHANAGNSLVSDKSLFLGADIGVTNALDVADGRLAFAAANGPYLSSLRFGQRSVTLTVRVTGHQGDKFWTDWLADAVKDVEILLTNNATTDYFSFRCKSAKIAQIKQSFNGQRDVNEITYKAFYNATDTSPFLCTVQSAIAAYAIPITNGM